ncbi:amino acid--tRNA ligase-related protein [Nannocystis pusilla]|uniref:amino acid--tRNA ligase-related protein n=1 Tax=Nannocystis pusilla TaxID=889268 RepID=UPI003B80CFB2
MAAELGGLAWPARVQIWDAALAAVRGYFRDQGLREVSTPVRVPAVAVEPFIDPIAAPPGLLATSPELAMKRLLVRGSGPIFQVAHVFRRAEIGERHSEEFHLVEWYRLGADLDPLLADVEALVARVFAATGSNGHVPKTWQRALPRGRDRDLRRGAARRRGPGAVDRRAAAGAGRRGHPGGGHERRRRAARADAAGLDRVLHCLVGHVLRAMAEGT